jgi:peroxiredoxin
MGAKLNHNMIKNTLTLLLLFMAVLPAIAQTSFKKVDEPKGLPVGEKAYLFKVTDQQGQEYSLQDALEKGPVVVVFYRGQWCPVCNKHLSALQDGLDKIYATGATVVAISPEKTEYLQKTAAKTGAKFTLLHDKDYKIAQGYDVLFLPASTTRAMYNTALRAKLGEAHSDDSEQLPIPATYIINKDGKITWRHFDPDYKKRATVEEIVNALNQLR